MIDPDFTLDYAVRLILMAVLSLLAIALAMIDRDEP